MRKPKYLIVFFVISACTGVAGAQPSEVIAKMKRLTILSSSYEDVIKIFGTPVDGTAEKQLSEYFDSLDGRVFVEFASGLCVATAYSDGRPIGWKVPEGTVIGMTYRPKNRITPRELGAKFVGFKKTGVADRPRVFIFRNDRLGVEYVVDAKGQIESISYFPRSSLTRLHC